MSRAITRVIALVTSALCVAPVAAAQPSASDDAVQGVPASMPVDVVLVGRAGTEGALAERIRSWFGTTATLSITREEKLVAERVLGPLPTRRIAVWVTERTPGEARLYFAVTGETEGATRYLIRDVPLTQGFDEVGSERVAQVVHSSVTALVEGSVEVAERPEIERELAAPAEPAKPSLARPHPPVYVAPPPPRNRPERASPGPSFSPLAGAFYRGAFAGDEGFAHGPGVALGATFGFGRFGVGAVARGQYVFPHSESFEDLDIMLSGFAARLGARGVWRSGLVELDLELGGGLSWVRYDPEETPSGPLPAARDVDQRFSWFLGVGASRRIGLVRAGARLELDAYPVRAHYELGSGKEIGSASRFQPALALEMMFD
ncbi:MAG TPA: hypothetical protein VF103_02140 [Polyangiaceae bacterium]